MVKKDYAKTRGDDWAFRLNFYSDLQQTVPINITDWTIWLTVKKLADNSDDDAKAIIQEKIIAGGADAVAGKVSVDVPHTKTRIAPAAYKYDFQFETPGERILTFQRGRLVVEDDTTKDEDA
jgi:hypothetical protein